MQVEHTNKLLNLSDYNYYSDTFIETGSCMGDGIKRAIIAGYQKIKSVEIHEPFYLHCLKIFAPYASGQGNWTTVSLYLGSSEEYLPSMLNGVEKAVIFLDAHPAGPNTGGHEDLMLNGADSPFHQDRIILNELALIMKQGGEHIIIIDDQQGETDESKKYMKYLYTQRAYKFLFYDEKLAKDAQHYKSKLLVCIPI